MRTTIPARCTLRGVITARFQDTGSSEVIGILTERRYGASVFFSYLLFPLKVASNAPKGPQARTPAPLRCRLSARCEPGRGWCARTAGHGTSWAEDTPGRERPFKASGNSRSFRDRHERGDDFRHPGRRHRVVASMTAVVAFLPLLLDIDHFAIGPHLAVPTHHAAASQCREAEEVNETHSDPPLWSVRKRCADALRRRRPAREPQHRREWAEKLGFSRTPPPLFPSDRHWRDTSLSQCVKKWPPFGSTAKALDRQTARSYLLVTRHSLLVAHHSLLVTHCSLPRSSLLAPRSSFLVPHCSYCSLLVTRYSLPFARHSLLSPRRAAAKRRPNEGPRFGAYCRVGRPPGCLPYTRTEISRLESLQRK